MAARRPRPGGRQVHPAVAVILAVGALLGLAARPPAASPAPRFPCITQVDRAIAPSSIVPGQVTTVTARLDIRCDASAWARRLVLVVDASEDISDERLDRLRIGLQEAVDRLAPVMRQGQGLEVAVLPFDGRGLLPADQRFSADPRFIRDAIGKIERSLRTCGAAPASDCHASAALRHAAKMLATDVPPDGAKNLVLLASTGIDAADPSTCASLRQAARELRDGPNSMLMTSCATDTEDVQPCSNRCLSGLASDQDVEFFSGSPNWPDFASIFEALGEGSGRFHPIRLVEFYDDIPEFLTLAGGDPPNQIVDRKLVWVQYPVTSDFTVQAHYALEAQVCSDGGPRPSSEDTAYRIEYRPLLWGRDLESGPLPIQPIDIPCFVPSSTPTPDGRTASPTASPTPTRTPSPSHTPSPTASASPETDVTPTSRAYRAFLPFLLRRDPGRACDWGPRDLVLVLDVSRSMGGRHGPADGGGAPFGDARKAEVARRLARAALAALSPATDRAAVVRYGREAFASEGGLVPCCQPALDALADPRVELYSFPWLGLTAAATAMNGAPPPPDLARRALLFITDQAASDLSPGDQALTQDAARAARAGGMEVLALGIGARADEAFLMSLTGGRAGRVLLSRRIQGEPEAVVGDWLACLP